MKRLGLTAAILVTVVCFYTRPWEVLNSSNQTVPNGADLSAERPVPLETKLLDQKISDREVHKAEGIVVKAFSQEPVPGAEVRLFNETRVLKVETDENGRFFFNSIPRGVYSLQASSNYWHSFRNTRDMARIVVDAETILIGPITLTLAESGHYQAQVVSARNGQPLVKARVLAPGLRKEMVTDEKGMVPLPVPSGIWMLEIRHPGYMPNYLKAGFSGKLPKPLVIAMEPAGGMTIFVGEDENQPLEGVSATIDPGRSSGLSDEGGEINLEHLPLNKLISVRLNKPGFRRFSKSITLRDHEPHVALTVVLERSSVHDYPPSRSLTVEGRVIDALGGAIAGASITLPRLNLETRSDQTGQFVLGPFQSGGRFFSLHVKAPGFSSNQADLEINEPETELVNIQVVMKGELTFSGHVLDEEGFTVPSGQVRAFNPNSVASGSTQTNIQPDGSFHLEAISPGMGVVVEAPGFAPQHIKAPNFEQDQEIVLHPYQIFYGQVVDRGTEEPVHSFQLELPWGETAWYQTDDGLFQLDDVPPGETLDLLVAANQYLPQKYKDLRPEESDSENRVLLELGRKGLNIEGYVLDTSLKPRAGYSVLAVDSFSNPELFKILSGARWRYDALRLELFDGLSRGASIPGAEVRIANSRGAFQFKDLPQGVSVHLLAFGPGMAPTVERNVQDSEMPLKMILPTTGSISVVMNRENLPDINGSLLAGMVKEIWTNGKSRARREGNLFTSLDRSTDHFEFTGLAPGIYNLFVGIYDSPGNDRRISEQRSIELEEGENKTLKLGFNYGTVSGTAFLDGRPLSNATLYLYKESRSRHHQAMTNSEGWFQFTKTSPGNYLVVFRGTERPGSGNYFLPPQAGFNAISVDVNEAGLEQNFFFREYGGLTGRLVTQLAGYSFYLEWKSRQMEGDPGSSIYAGGFVRPDNQGQILVQSLPPGTGRLFAQNGSTRFVIKDHIVISGNEVLDLGDLEIPFTGRVRVRLVNPDEKAGSVSLHLLRGGEDKPLIRAYMPMTGDFMLEEVPAGSIELVFPNPLQEYRLSPASQFIQVEADRETEVVVQLERTAGLYFTMEHETTYQRAILTHLETGEIRQTDPIVRYRPGSGPNLVPYIYDGEAYHLISGLWQLDVYMEDGAVFTEHVQIQPGKKKFLTVAINP